MIRSFVLFSALGVFVAHSAVAAEKQITILSTNDIHGATAKLPLWSGMVKAIRDGIAEKNKQKQKAGSKDEAGVLLVDAGDQFSGTLLSNFNEGKLIFSIMDKMNYDALVPGNHDYDFGPIGWLQDKAKNKNERREALLAAKKGTKFALLSANTFYKGTKQRPEFLTPYVIKTVAGVRVALIGIDNESTPSSTTKENVSDLTFADELETYRNLREELDSKADVFVMVIHNGDTDKEHGATQMIKALTEGDKPLVDAVISGHTHWFTNETVREIPLVQSGSSGKAFGRVDLFWNDETKTLDRKKTFRHGGINVARECRFEDRTFCEMKHGELYFEGEKVTEDKAVEAQIKEARKALAPIGNRVLGEAKKELTKDRINESYLANILTDIFKEMSGADVAIMNAGGIRTNIAQGTVTYEKFFEVLPFANHGVLMEPMKTSTLLKLLRKSVRTCGNFGTLVQSGLRVTYTRHCPKPEERAKNDEGIDPKAELRSVATVDGVEILSPQGDEHEHPLSIATLDFLSVGGSGFDAFQETKVKADLGILREEMTTILLKNPRTWDGDIDARWKNLSE